MKLGGIDVYLTKEEAAYYDTRVYNAGMPPLHEGVQTLNGNLALQTRATATWATPTLDRTRRQRDVLAVFNKSSRAWTRHRPSFQTFSGSRSRM